MATGINTKEYFYETVDVTIVSGAGTKAVTFTTAFKSKPVILAIPFLGSPASVSAASITTTGFTFTVTGETNVPDNEVAVYAYFAHEKL